MNWNAICLILGIIGVVWCAVSLRTEKEWRATIGFMMALNIHTIVESLTAILKH